LHPIDKNECVNFGITKNPVFRSLKISLNKIKNNQFKKTKPQNLKSIISHIRKVGFGIIILIYFLSLFNSIFFLHSHWYNGHLVALHAHPYNLSLEGEGNKKKDTHSKKEYELYDLIYHSPILELEFFNFEISLFYDECHDSFADFFISYESKVKPFHHGRGPPVLI
jgi:hypothetical protein